MMLLAMMMVMESTMSVYAARKDGKPVEPPPPPTRKERFLEFIGWCFVGLEVLVFACVPLVLVALFVAVVWTIKGP
jgi:hypothetical protein